MTTSSSLQQFKEMGESLGLAGAELLEFMKQQQALERAERQAEKEAKEKQRQFELDKADRDKQEKEKDRERRDKEMKFYQAEVAEKERERQHELEQRRQELELAAAEEEKRRQAEEKKMQFQLRKKEEEGESERLTLAAEREQREYEDVKLAREREQARFAADRAEELEKRRHAHEMEKMHTEFRVSEEAKKTPSKDNRNADSGHSGTGFIKAPKISYFDEDKDFMDSYLNRFEQFATSQRWDPSTWALCLSALLRGRALDVYSMMAKDDVNDYEKLKSALLKRYQLTADSFRKRFRTSRPEPGKSPSQFITRIGNYLQRWIDLAKAAETYDGAKKLFIEEQYLRTCPKEMATHLPPQHTSKTLHDLTERANTYLEAPTPVISSSGSIRSFLRSEDHSNQRDAITVDPQVTSGTSVPSHSRQCLQRIQGHHSLGFDHLVHSRSHQAMLPSNPHHLNESHYGATPSTRSGTSPETAVQNPPLQWNSRDTTSLHHSRTTSSSLLPTTSTTPYQKVTGQRICDNPRTRLCDVTRRLL